MLFVKRCSIFRSAVSTGFTRRAESTNSRRRKRCSMWIFRNPFTCSWIVSQSIRNRARVWLTPSKFVTAKGRAKPFSNSSRTMRGIRPSGARSTNDSNARMTARFTRNLSPGFFPSTIPTERVRAARVRKYDRFRSKSRRARSEQVARRRRHRAVDETPLPRTFPGSKKVGARSRDSDERAVATTDCRTAPPDSGGRPRERVRRGQRFFQLAGAQDIQAACPGFSEPLPRLCEVSRMRGDAFACGGPRRSRGGESHHGGLQAHGQRSARFLFHTAALRRAPENRGQDSGRDSNALTISG